MLVTGATADFLDFQESLEEHLPLALAIIVIATVVVLFLMTGSVVLPVKQLLMNVLNLSAVFGILVFIFQDGRLEGLLDYQSQGALEQTMPILLFAVAFGLSTDYGVFLLSRIKEARDAGASDSECIAIGLERTGRIVTAAAVLFAIAIGAFATSEIIFIKQNGIGTALAVLIDATIIRALLVPSLMELLGRWNWWAPKPLRRLHWRIGLSETPPDAGRNPSAGTRLREEDAMYKTIARAKGPADLRQAERRRLAGHPGRHRLRCPSRLPRRQRRSAASALAGGDGALVRAPLPAASRARVRGRSTSRSDGWPWDMWVGGRMGRPRRGRRRRPLRQRGRPLDPARRGKATYIHAYLDTQEVTETCDAPGGRRLEEAAAPPITD